MLYKVKYLISLLKKWIDIYIGLKSIAYFITFLYLLYILYICFFAEPNRFLVGNVGIKLDSIDFGGLGSLLAGIFSPLAFLWLLLTFKQTDKNLRIAQKQLHILEDKERLRKKLIQPILLNHSLKEFNRLSYDGLVTYIIELELIGSISRIFPTIKENLDKCRIEDKIRHAETRHEVDCFPLYKSFDNCLFNFLVSISFNKIQQDELFEIELNYLDIDGNDHTTIIYLYYSPKYIANLTYKNTKSLDVLNSLEVSLVKK